MLGHVWEVAGGYWNAGRQICTLYLSFSIAIPARKDIKSFWPWENYCRTLGDCYLSGEHPVSKRVFFCCYKSPKMFKIRDSYLWKSTLKPWNMKYMHIERAWHTRGLTSSLTIAKICNIHPKNLAKNKAQGTERLCWGGLCWDVEGYRGCSRAWGDENPRIAPIPRLWPTAEREEWICTKIKTSPLPILI